MPAMVAAGDLVRASDVVTIACRVGHNTTQSIPHSATTVVAFNDEDFDPSGLHSTSTNNSRITFTEPGIYLVGFQYSFASSGDYTRIRGDIRMNGATNLVRTAGSPSFVPEGEASTIYQFSAGDYVEALLFQQNGASAARDLNSSDEYSPRFYAFRLGVSE